MDNVIINIALAAEGVTIRQIATAIVEDAEAHRTMGESQPNEVYPPDYLASIITGSPSYGTGYAFSGAAFSLNGKELHGYNPCHSAGIIEDDYPLSPAMELLDEAPEGAVFKAVWNQGDSSSEDHYRKRADGKWLHEYSWDASEEAWEDQCISQSGCLLTPGIRERVARTVGMECRSVFNAAFDAAVSQLRGW